MAEVLEVAVRDTRGTRHARRMRDQGLVPGIVYGHGQDPVSVGIAKDLLAAAVRHGSRLVELRGAVTEKAIIRELQWDVYGQHVVHVDFARVSEGERIRMTVPLELKGASPGAKDGGVVEHNIHEVEIECPVIAIPDKLLMSINDLQLGGHKTLGQLELPEGVTLLDDAEQVVVHCVTPTDEDAEAAPAAVEPELIGRKAAEEDEEE